MPSTGLPMDPAVWKVLELAVVDHDFLILLLANVDEALKAKQIVLTNAQRAQFDSILLKPLAFKSGQELLEMLNKIFKYYDDPILNPTPPPPPTW